ncbi:hypothetical protein KPL42_01495 [Clostridium gasigenes]|uniref:ABC-three component system middle component 6 n=1 Tax=Clostridium gasigenes TaxID=94869 RepID=UPI001C0E4781|nr:ABC-three component system middle component 6 [Clostridium gasigenes]MBU3087158.1 hypothetical protein [Clostridium gasigenes]
MLLPDNINPELSIYYNGAMVLEELQRTLVVELIDLYQIVRNKVGMSFSTLLLSLDWLYLIGIAKLNEKGEVELCS